MGTTMSTARFMAAAWSESVNGAAAVKLACVTSTHRCKTFLRFFLNFGHVLTFLTFFLFSKRFLIFFKNVGKVQSGKQINKKHFQNNSNEIQ